MGPNSSLDGSGYYSTFFQYVIEDPEEVIYERSRRAEQCRLCLHSRPRALLAEQVCREHSVGSGMVC